MAARLWSQKPHLATFDHVVNFSWAPSLLETKQRVRSPHGTTPHLKKQFPRPGNITRTYCLQVPTLQHLKRLRKRLARELLCGHPTKVHLPDLRNVVPESPPFEVEERVRQQVELSSKKRQANPARRTSVPFPPSKTLASKGSSSDTNVVAASGGRSPRTRTFGPLRKSKGNTQSSASHTTLGQQTKKNAYQQLRQASVQRPRKILSHAHDQGFTKTRSTDSPTTSRKTGTARDAAKKALAWDRTLVHPGTWTSRMCPSTSRVCPAACPTRSWHGIVSPSSIICRTETSRTITAVRGKMWPATSSIQKVFSNSISTFTPPGPARLACP